jgi:hypothetical protein
MPIRERAARVATLAKTQNRLPVELWIEEDEGDSLLLQRAANLSPAGAVFSHTSARDPGAQVKIRFTLPGEYAPIQCVGEIVSADGDGDDWQVGVRFVDLPADVRRRIASLLGGTA